ncbi:MAG: hypothetical protein AAGB35_05395 [Pseudomonadota bacterium]
MYVSSNAYLKFLALLTLILFSIPISSANNWTWLERSPLVNFNDEDWSLLMSTGEELLENGSNGQISSWENDQTDNFGTMKILETTTKSGLRCRTIEFYNAAPNYSSAGSAVHMLCKQSDDTWKITPRK